MRGVLGTGTAVSLYFTNRSVAQTMAPTAPGSGWSATGIKTVIEPVLARGTAGATGAKTGGAAAAAAAAGSVSHCHACDSGYGR
jgi:hypothetical protein